MVDYTDGFTLDGRLKPVYGVTKAKVEAADKLLAEAMHGSAIASGMLKEVHTTSDLKFNLAHLITTVMIPQFDEAERTWSQVAGTRVVPDFNPVQLFSLFGELTGPGVNQNGGLNRVPEASPYPYVTVKGQEAFYQKLSKFGAKFGFTWESTRQDVTGFFEQMPAQLVELALDTEEREVYQALINGTTATLASQTLPSGTVTQANGRISPDTIWAAIMQLQNVEINSRKVGRSSNGYNVVVPAGTKDALQYELNRTIISIQDGLVTYGPNDYSAISNINIVETSFLTGTQWIVLPKPGGIRRPVLELMRLRGYETPELRVHGDTGQYLGGSAVSPFEGNFDSDTIDYRIRYVAGGVLWSNAYSVKSSGVNPAVNP